MAELVYLEGDVDVVTAPCPKHPKPGVPWFDPDADCLGDPRCWAVLKGWSPPAYERLLDRAEVMNVRGQLVLIHAPIDLTDIEGTDLAAACKRIHRDAGAALVLVAAPDLRVEALDADAMRAAGWKRRRRWKRSPK